MLDKIREKRQLLHKELDLQSIDSREVLKISEELDELLVEYYRNIESGYEKEGGT